MKKVNVDTIKPWVTQKITEILGFEDDVVIGYVFNHFEERVSGSKAGERQPFLACGAFKIYIYSRAAPVCDSV